MRVVIIDHYDDGKRQTIDGNEAEVAAQLRSEFPWVAERVPYGDVTALVKELDRGQAFTARVVTDPGLVGD